MTRASQSTPAFLYVAATPKGRRFGVRQARSERALSAELRADKLVLLKSWRLPGFLATERKLTLKDQAQLNELLGQLVGRGVPLVEALGVISQTVRPAARPRVHRLAELVAQGASFSNACRRVGGFDEVTIAVYQSAERTGDLAGSATQMAVSARRRMAVAGKAVTLLIYPALVMLIGVLVAIVMLTWIVPKIAGALEQSGMRLPAFTRAMAATGVAIRSNWMLVVLAVLVALTALVIGRAAVARIVRRAMHSIPLLSGVVRAQESAGFFSVMSAMSRSGVPLADALGVAVHAVGDPKLRRELTTLRTRLIEGGVLKKLIDEVTSLPLAVRRLLIAAERAGDLETAFGALADDMTAEVEKRSGRLLAGLEPALLVLLFTLIGSMLLSIMIPLMSATSRAFG
ncbi:MAG: type II secretion system F family protein [Phycisphaeraceae bacterium]|nr:type II secretion system F family protein [Phycisphaeraceae bacterium]